MMSDTTDSPWTEMTVNRVALDMKRVGATVRQSMEFSSQVVQGGDFREQLEHRVKAFVLTEHLASNTVRVDVDYTYEVPASAWDAFKEEQVEATSPLWRWVARRRPPKYVTREGRATRAVAFKREAMFPEANIAIRDDRLGAPVIFETVEVEQ